MTAISHVAFSDETKHNIGRFRGLCVVSTTLADLRGLEEELQKLWVESGVTEFKWTKLKSAKYGFAAEKIIAFSVEHAIQGHLRIDTLIWDTRDSRHNVTMRDDQSNLQRMYFHLYKNVLKMRWPADSQWELRPDENSWLEWNQLQMYLKEVGMEYRVKKSDIFAGIAIEFIRKYDIQSIVPVDSKVSPISQVADFFVGLASFSWECYDRFQDWQIENPDQPTLIQSVSSQSEFSNSDNSRFRLLRWFNTLCKRNRLSVSLSSSRGLRTMNPSKPINFWLYKPQNDLDVAPIKGQAY